MHATRESLPDRAGADTPGAAHRWLSVGSSPEPDSPQSGEEAARQALRGRSDARLLMVFCSTQLDPEGVLTGIRSIDADTPLIGCSTAAVISADGPDREHGVVIVAIGGTGFTVATAAALDAATAQRAAGARVAGCAAEVEERPHQVLILLTDGLGPGQEDILAGAYSVVGASMPLLGGAASPSPAERRTFHLYGGKVLTNAVVGAVIGSDGPFGVGLRHGWRKVGEPMIVTKSAHGEVFTLDDQPALAAYLQRLGAPTDAYADPQAFEKFAQTRPIGVRRRSGEEVRNVSSTARLREGWLRSTGEVPEGGLIWPMEGDRQSVLDAAGDACEAAMAALDGRPPLGLIAFNCESRVRLLGTEGMREEVARMAERADGIPLAGLYTWGEIARLRGINGFHNQTLVVLAVG
jgi:hypothetical protein